jgi:esterase/lipase superfamily enzyme
MKKYMAHYLATTDPSAMPSEVIIEDSQKTIFTNFLCKDTVKRIIIGIHGFNVPFHGALTSFSVLADTLSVALQDLGTTLITEPIIHEEFERSQDGESLKSVRFEYDPILDQADQDLTAFVGFSWPSNGKLLDYLSDRAEAVQTALP